jgi:chitinase
MMKDKAKLLSLQNTDARIESLTRQQAKRTNQTTRLIAFAGFDANKGKAYGTTLDGGTVYFDLETNTTPSAGQTLEVAIARNTLYGKGDLRPVK